MDTTTKKRLAGVMALLALGIIFLPSLFYREPIRVVVDTTTQIPPKPLIESVVVAPQPVPQAIIPAPSSDDAFQPPVASEMEHEAEQVSTGNASTSETVSPKPSLNDKGLPNAWVVQVASFSSQARAEELTAKLQKKDYKSYHRAVMTSKGKYYRVFVGPFIDKARAVSSKKVIDKTYRVRSQVLTFAAE